MFALTLCTDKRTRVKKYLAKVSFIRLMDYLLTENGLKQEKKNVYILFRYAFHLKACCFRKKGILENSCITAWAPQTLAHFATGKGATTLFQALQYFLEIAESGTERLL